MGSNPILSEFKAEIIKYIDLEQEINDVPDFFKVGHKALQLNSAPIKLALKVEAQNWKMAIGKSLNFKYRDILEECVSFVADYSRRLAHPIKDLEDVRFVMAALGDIRQNEIRIDMSLSPIEVTFRILFTSFIIKISFSRVLKEVLQNKVKAKKVF